MNDPKQPPLPFPNQPQQPGTMRTVNPLAKLDNGGALTKVVNDLQDQLEALGINFGGLFIGYEVAVESGPVGIASGFILPDGMTPEAEMSLYQDMGRHLMHLTAALEKKEKEKHRIIIPGRS